VWSAIPVLLLVGLTWSGLNAIYQSYTARSVLADEDQHIVSIVVMGLPLLIVGVWVGIVYGLRKADSFTWATPWDVLRIDLLELALAASDPSEMLIDTSKARLDSLEPQLQEKILDTTIRSIFLELLEEAAERTLTNFSTTLRSMPYASDRVTKGYLKQTGASLAATLQAEKPKSFVLTREIQAESFSEKFQIAANDEWAKMAAPGEFAIARPWWLMPAVRVGVALTLMAAAIVAPIALEGATGATVRAALVPVAIAALFSNLAVTGQRTYEVMKASSSE
jgi:hypothetical protein